MKAMVKSTVLINSLASLVRHPSDVSGRGPQRRRLMPLLGTQIRIFKLGMAKSRLGQAGL
jgi:hypothetical protein